MSNTNRSTDLRFSLFCCWAGGVEGKFATCCESVVLSAAVFVSSPLALRWELINENKKKGIKHALNQESDLETDQEKKGLY